MTHTLNNKHQKVCILANLYWCVRNNKQPEKACVQNNLKKLVYKMTFNQLRHG